MFDWFFNLLAKIGVKSSVEKALNAEIARRITIETELRTHKEDLEELIQARTTELREVNILLCDEMAARKKISDELAIQAIHLSNLQKATVQTCAILDSLMQLAPVGMAFFDCNGRYIKINNWLAKINGKLPEEYVGKKVNELTEISPKIKIRLQEVMANSHTVMDDEVSAMMPDGRKHTWLVSYYQVYTPDNNRLGIGVVVKDVTEQKQLEAELRKSVIEITGSDRQKTEFLAMLAHELRNPLSPILNSVYLLDGMLKKGDVDYEARSHAFQVIGRQVQHMSRLLDDLLDIARISKGKIKLRKEAVDVNSLLRHVYDLQKPAAEIRRHQTIINLTQKSLIVNADPTRLEQVFGNIYSNATKYTEPGGCIEIASDVVDDWVVVVIKDNGIGISAKTLPTMFEIFAQASQSLDRPQGGLGIGLALSKDLVCMHGGKIEAKSDGLGHGSEFIIKLPIMKINNYKSIDNEEYHDLLPISNKQLRVLIVDDNIDAAETLAMLLNHSGHETQMVNDGATALKKVGVYNPDAILLDIGLPGLDGYTCCELLRESNYGGLMIAITGYGSEVDRVRSKEAGFNHHLVKPVNPVELAQLLNEYADSM